MEIISLTDIFFYDTFIAMKKEIKILIDQYGSKKAVAHLLGITVRHVENCQKGNHIGKPLEKLIRSYSVQFER